MHDGLKYDPIQGKGHGHYHMKVGFYIFVLVFVSRDFEVVSK